MPGGLVLLVHICELPGKKKIIYRYVFAFGLEKIVNVKHVIKGKFAASFVDLIAEGGHSGADDLGHVGIGELVPRHHGAKLWEGSEGFFW